jgi:hypothetical protein
MTEQERLSTIILYIKNAARKTEELSYVETDNLIAFIEGLLPVTRKRTYNKKQPTNNEVN